MRDFRTYSEAKREGDKLVADLAKGSRVTALTPGQANDALAALERLQGFYQSTGRRVSLLAGISEYCEASAKLGGYTDRKSTRLNSSHLGISYAVFCFKKKK